MVWALTAAAQRDTIYKKNSNGPDRLNVTVAFAVNLHGPREIIVGVVFSIETSVQRPRIR